MLTILIQKLKGVVFLKREKLYIQCIYDYLFHILTNLVFFLLIIQLHYQGERNIVILILIISIIGKRKMNQRMKRREMIHSIWNLVDVRIQERRIESFFSLSWIDCSSIYDHRRGVKILFIYLFQQSIDNSLVGVFFSNPLIPFQGPINRFWFIKFGFSFLFFLQIRF